MLYICNIKPPKHGQDGKAATPISPHHDRSKGGERSEGEDLTTPPGARRRSAPTRQAFGKPPAQAGIRPAPRPEHGRFPGQAALKKAAWGRTGECVPPQRCPRSITRAPPLERDVRNPGKKRTLTSLVKTKRRARLLSNHARMPENISSVNPGSAYPSQDYGNVSCAPHTPVWR